MPESGVIIRLVGRKGSGKSTLMTGLLYDDHKKLNRKIFLNYPVRFPYEHIEFDDLFSTDEVIPKRFWNSTIGWDEATSTGFDARDSMMKITKEDITDFVYQTRKADIVFMYSSKRFSDIEGRLRDQSDLVILCRAIPPFGVPRMFVFRFAVPPEYTLSSWRGFEDWIELRRAIIPASSPAILKAWSLFDTKRMIDAKRIRRQKRERNEELKARKKKKVKAPKRVKKKPIPTIKGEPRVNPLAQMVQEAKKNNKRVFYGKNEYDEMVY